MAGPWVERARRHRLLHARCFSRFGSEVWRWLDQLQQEHRSGCAPQLSFTESQGLAFPRDPPTRPRHVTSSCGLSDRIIRLVTWELRAPRSAKAEFTQLSLNVGLELLQFDLRHILLF